MNFDSDPDPGSECHVTYSLVDLEQDPDPDRDPDLDLDVGLLREQYSENGI